MPLGYLCLVLHAHLPYVRHPEWDDFLEEDWLYEAITETYIPLLEVFDGLERDGVDWRMTMSVTPTLAAMLADPLLQYRYVRHLDNLIALAGKEVERTRWQPEFHHLALMYQRRFIRAHEVFVTQYRNNLVNGFRRFFETGKLELIACAATHGFLPLLTINRNAVWAQIEIGCRAFEWHFGRRPQGIWLPECGYAPGIDEMLRDAGLRYFFTDTHGVLFAEPRPRFGVYAPIVCPASGVAVLARDTESSKQVWSSIEGYPGDYNYREFYRDVGFDLDYDYLRPHLHQSGIRSHLGIKYYKITGRTEHKQPYDPKAALEKAAEHAGNFMFNREKQVEWLSGSMDGRPALIVAPYDAELFGHWWFEGPDWINFLLRKICYDQQTIKTITVPEYLERHPRLQLSQPVFSSWGYKGYCEVWLEGSNDWIYPHLHEIADRMVELARENPDPSPLRRRALNQAARELLLAQSSDWAFIMKTGTMVEYARERTRVHILNFNHLYEQLQRNDIDEPWLAEVERRHNIFPDLDYRVYA
ncbi:MAG TPA: 1,4-alpha-glucan branching protein domain-containing protein [Gemmataceae bacterium]|nr:1,4-alpha-glucan branching protein domain-containing protein [Gemmataceae bacterium]